MFLSSANMGTAGVKPSDGSEVLIFRPGVSSVPGQIKLKWAERSAQRIHLLLLLQLLTFSAAAVHTAARRWLLTLANDP